MDLAGKSFKAHYFLPLVCPLAIKRQKAVLDGIKASARKVHSQQARQQLKRKSWETLRRVHPAIFHSLGIPWLEIFEEGLAVGL